MSASAVADELVLANHILADQQVLDGFGHVSVRHPARADRFLLSRSMASALVTAGDIVEYNLSADAVDGDARKSYVERFIHAEIYRARADVQAIVHSHAPAVLPFTVSSVPLRPVYHMAGFLGAGVGRFDIRRVTGRATDLLVCDAALGRALAEALGAGSVVLMRGHGLTVVARSLRDVVYRAIYTEVDARIQTAALLLGGGVEALADEEAALADAVTSANVDRPWELWKRAALARRAERESR